MLVVDEVFEVTDDVVVAVRRLAGQLSASSAPPTPTDLEELVAAPATTLLVARDNADDGAIIGMLTLATFRIPTGVRA
ncbi:MAG TPA: GNAT family N-acetyltransferase, partial [Acidimicrobiales bacterium]|nr:GNAT family N-acetyltransferase [Acidimicrobiales bacterium]